MTSVVRIFRVLWIFICLISVVVSYNIDRDRSSHRGRAVTEWRFRRNNLLKLPHYFRLSYKNNHWTDGLPDETMSNEELKSDEKRFIVPELVYHQWKN